MIDDKCTPDDSGILFAMLSNKREIVQLVIKLEMRFSSLEMK